MGYFWPLICLQFLPVYIVLPTAVMDRGVKVNAPLFSGFKKLKVYTKSPCGMYNFGDYLCFTLICYLLQTDIMFLICSCTTS